MGQDEAAGGVAADEEGGHEEPEGGDLRGLRDGDAPVGGEGRHPGGRNSVARAVRLEPLFAGAVPHEPDRDRQDQREERDAEPEVTLAPAVGHREPHREGDDHELARRHRAPEEPDDEAPVGLEPARRHAGGRRHPRPARADGHQDARGDVDVPEALDEAGEDGAGPEHEEAHGQDPPGPPPVGQPSHEGPDGAQEEEGEGRGPRESRPVPVEVGLQRLDEDAEDRAEAGGGDHHEHHRAQYHPRVMNGVRPALLHSGQFTR